tara:strand:+ start:6147 stop:7373 length:1227 start_codon:yes stop_codon:yes gene_type:complete
MDNFKTFISEAKNTHMEHLEDEILNNGVTGIKTIIQFLVSLGKSLSGPGISTKEMTVKWDGKPAIFAGNDPKTGKFFVGTKSIFNKNPKLNFTKTDIQNNHGHAAGLAEKLEIALTYLSKVGIPKGEVWQGDIMFSSSDKSTEKINDKTFLTFQPNTIKYAVQAGSDLYNRINKAKFGVVWHTKYTGSDLEDMSASYGVDVSKLNRVRDVWFDDANYRDVTGMATFSKTESKTYNTIVKNVMSLQKKVDKRFLRTLLNTKKSIGVLYKSYVNSRIKSGQEVVASPVSYYEGFYSYVGEYWQKKIDGVKTDKAKKQKRIIKDEALDWIEGSKTKIKSLAKFYIEVIKAKLLLLSVLDRASNIKHFQDIGNGFEITGPEGFVAIQGAKAVKLVDRMVFSKANFLFGKSAK